MLLRICSIKFAVQGYTPAIIALLQEVDTLTGQRWRMFVIIGLLALGGCGEPADRREVAFTSVAASSEMAGIAPDHYRGAAVLLALASNDAEKRQLEALPPVNLKRTVGELSLEGQVLIAVFQGEKKGSGYAVEIKRVVDENSDVYIYARFETPKPGQLQDGATRSPVSIVSVERSALPFDAPLTVHVLDIDSGREVLAADYTIK